MGYSLRALDVATAINSTLAGSQSKAALGKWAHQAMLRNDAGTLPFDPKHTHEIGKALHRLFMMTEGSDYELTDAELRAMIEKLNQLDSSDRRP